jgi:transcriptional regulator with XRE-family HTH domain
MKVTSFLTTVGVKAGFRVLYHELSFWLMYNHAMEIGQKLRELRKAKKLSQGDVEHRTGLLRCYSSRVENGHTVPTLDTLEKYARALEVPLYRFFTDEETVKMPRLPANSKAGSSWGVSGKDLVELRLLTEALGRMDERDQRLLVCMAQKLASRH